MQRGKRRKRENKDDKKKWNEMRRIKIEEQRDKLKERKKKKWEKGREWNRLGASAVSMAQRNVSTLKYSARHRLELLPD